jgi:hypothetical protein
MLSIMAVHTTLQLRVFFNSSLKYKAWGERI